ncbi:MAG TPA: succinylglutamate desuccinylase/aspartoacylase family protein [Kiloniellales bacterium]
MARQIDRLVLQGTTPGTRREVILRRYGNAGARPKAYVQASLHADETPALLVAHHLARLLDAAQADGAMRGEAVLVPYANPIGLGQFVNGEQLGRYELRGGGNFNRNWPDLFSATAAAVDGKLSASAEDNVALIRAALREALAAVAAQPVRNELFNLRLTLAREAVDADMVLDLHCDEEALIYLFVTPAHWPQAQVLAAELGCRAVLLAEQSGGNSFDEAYSTPWLRLAERFPNHPIPAACLAGTVELRGQADVGDSLAEADAAALFRSLQRHGVIAGDPGPARKLLCEATRLDACDSIKAPAPGMLSYVVELGDRVRKGDIIAWLIDPAADDPLAGRQPIHAGTDGLVLSRRLHKFTLPGMTVAKVVGTQTLPSRKGAYLLDD